MSGYAIAVRNVEVALDEPCERTFQMIGSKVIRDTNGDKGAVLLGYFGEVYWIPKSCLLLYRGNFYAKRSFMRHAVPSPMTYGAS